MADAVVVWGFRIGSLRRARREGGRGPEGVVVVVVMAVAGKVALLVAVVDGPASVDEDAWERFEVAGPDILSVRGSKRCDRLIGRAGVLYVSTGT